MDDHTQINAKRVVIATGSRPSYPGFFNNVGDRLIVNDHVFDWQDLPESVAVFGPGVIGLELGQALHRLGVKVKVFGIGGALGPLTDPEVAAYSKAKLAQEFYLDTDAKVLSMRKTGDKAELHFVNLDGEEVAEEFDYLLAATGRRPKYR